MSSSTSEIKVIVKSPAQKTEDQTIVCDLDWTVFKLKTFISQNFALKPAISDQRLIYSGHLMKDEKTLEEIFQPTEQDNSTFAVHLVFSQKNSNDTKNNKVNNTDTTNVNNRTINGSSNANQSINQPSSNISSSSFNLTNGNMSVDLTNLYAQQMQQYQQMYVNYMVQFLINQNNSNQPLQQHQQQQQQQHNNNLMCNAFMTGLPMVNPMLFNPLLTVPNIAHLSSSIGNNSVNGVADLTSVNSSSSSNQTATNETIVADENRAPHNDQNDVDGAPNNGWFDMIQILWNILIVYGLIAESFSRTLFVVGFSLFYYLYYSGYFAIIRARLFGQSAYTANPSNTNNNARRLPNNEDQIQQMMDNNLAMNAPRARVVNNDTTGNQTDLNNNEPEHFVTHNFRFLWMVISSLFGSLMPIHNANNLTPAN